MDEAIGRAREIGHKEGRAEGEIVGEARGVRLGWLQGKEEILRQFVQGSRENGIQEGAILFFLRKVWHLSEQEIVDLLQKSEK